ncbi:PRC-barrel domain-containing protein [Roseicitreum antarcticum]|uniref:PRC-barrel domain-containing protein n=1 Tax=Roseicitreum antarcticum TaxID=564137 RepID=A0A1H2VGZ9_9RHOB|nr:PRC-barrel domain-containing protein [Roseicitreum antarcticum]SDW67646.1 PRC-barrel domain-containing protein [Roseicitreum antarcticum]
MTDNTHNEARIVTENPGALNESGRLIASDRVEGTKVYNPEGEHVGSIQNFMVDKLNGKVSYAVMSFGGFLGIGERYHPLPWDALTFDPELGGYRVSVTRAQLEDAPSFAQDEDPWVDPEYGRNVYAFYGMPFYS